MYFKLVCIDLDQALDTRMIVFNNHPFTSNGVEIVNTVHILLKFSPHKGESVMKKSNLIEKFIISLENKYLSFLFLFIFSSSNEVTY
jgi:hypothetical protein